MSITKEDSRNLRVMQNMCLRMMTGSDRSAPTALFLQTYNQFSAHQTVAHQSSVQVFNALKNKAPTHHHQRLFPHQHEQAGHPAVINLNRGVNFEKSLGRSSFFY